MEIYVSMCGSYARITLNQDVFDKLFRILILK